MDIDQGLRKCLQLARYTLNHILRFQFFSSLLFLKIDKDLSDVDVKVDEGLVVINFPTFPDDSIDSISIKFVPTESDEKTQVYN